MLNLLFFMAFTYVHPIHVSVCDVIQKNDKVEFTFKIFFDDLQTSMGLTPGEELPSKYSGSDQLINDFILKNVKVVVNGKVAKLKYKESYSAPPAIWTEMELEGVQAGDIKTMEIFNDIMVSLYRDQTNIINVAIKNTKKNFSLGKNDRSAKLVF
ncbi:MAG TPA: hypothetical protein PLY70_02390 [Saprospiraceae bacterium]|nr:hypothetical protein [Saprospiraceae bacterium]HPN68389.1 hypothetical protein [Saprospiraceae bacterium]